jgi:hypothetical protein
MPSILDQVSKSANHFHPTNIEQYTALQILLKLKGISYVRKYLVAAEHHPLVFLIDAYKRTVQGGGSSAEFFQHLDATTSHNTS